MQAVVAACVDVKSTDIKELLRKAIKQNINALCMPPGYTYMYIKTTRLQHNAPILKSASKLTVTFKNLSLLYGSYLHAESMFVWSQAFHRLGFLFIKATPYATWQSVVFASESPLNLLGVMLGWPLPMKTRCVFITGGAIWEWDKSTGLSVFRALSLFTTWQILFLLRIWQSIIRG